jgi:UDP-N-acetylglucosamine--N-acetylmuramyl-(pentapeptide) pyrophosphoryl-undecaprenol N-acetylglucosamine transferase
LIARDDEKYARSIQLIHSSGARFFDQIREMAIPPGLHYRPMAYIDHVDHLLPGIDLFIGRAGAMSLAECTALGIPMILIPWRGVHQAKNAEMLASKGAATLIYDDELNGERLYNALKTFIDDPEKRAAMAGESRKLGNPEAAGEVARILLDLSYHTHKKRS